MKRPSVSQGFCIIVIVALIAADCLWRGNDGNVPRTGGCYF